MLPYLLENCMELHQFLMVIMLQVFGKASPLTHAVIRKIRRWEKGLVTGLHLPRLRQVKSLLHAHVCLKASLRDFLLFCILPLHFCIHVFFAFFLTYFCILLIRILIHILLCISVTFFCVCILHILLCISLLWIPLLCCILLVQILCILSVIFELFSITFIFCFTIFFFCCCFFCILNILLHIFLHFLHFLHILVFVRCASK